MRRALFLLGVLSLGSSHGLAEEGKPKDVAGKSALLAEGQLQQVRTPLAKILQFTFDGPNLALDRKSWDAGLKDALPRAAAVNAVNQALPIEGLYRQIQSAAGPTGNSMSVGGRDRTLSFVGRDLHGRLEIRGDAVRMSLEEAEAPRRILEFSDDAQGNFRIQLTHPDGDLLLLQQTRKGVVNAVVTSGGRVFAGQGENFLAFLRKHRQAADTLILPVLEQFGGQPVLALNTPQVRNAVLAQVLRTPEALAEGRRLLADLDSAKFPVREEATKALNERFEVFKDLIQDRLQDMGTSLEALRRLQKIVTDQADSLRVSQTVAALELTKDAEYLVSLLDHVGANELPRYVSYLEKTTGEKLGKDPAAWKEWARKGRK